MSVARLREEHRPLEIGLGFASELRAMLLRPATRDSLRGTLKLEDHPTWENSR